MAEIVVSTMWDEVVDEVLRTPGVTMLVGDVDSGKSTLARHLSREAVQIRPVSTVDADVGQSSLCTPGTVSMAVFFTKREVEVYRCSKYVFIGTANPALAIHQIIEATVLLVEEGKKLGGTVIVDTGGLVLGQLGAGLKLAKIRRLQPDRIVTIQREDECEPILRHLDEIEIIRLPPSPYVAPRSREVRARYRLMKMKQFLEEGEQVEHLLPADAEVIRLGRPVSLRRVEIPEGTLVGLNHGQETLDIGLVTEGGASPLVRCRLKSLEAVTRIVYGDLTIADTMLEQAAEKNLASAVIFQRHG